MPETNFEMGDRVHFVGEYSFYCPSCGPVLDSCSVSYDPKKTLRTIEVIDQGDEWKVVCTCDVCEIIVNVFVKQP